MNNLTAAQPAAQFQPSNGPNPQQYAAQSMPDHIPQQQQDQMSQFYATQPSMNGGQQQFSNPTMRLPTGTLINQERNPANHTLVSVITPNVSGGGAYGMPQMSMAGMMPQQQGYMQQAQYGGWNGGQYVTPTVQYVPGQQYMPQGYVPVQAPQQPFRQMHQMPPPMSQPQYIQQQVPPPQPPPQPIKKRKVLAIVDPESKQLINEAEVASTTDKSEKTPSTTPAPVGTTETAGHRLTKEVANQLYTKGSSPLAQQVFEQSGTASVPSQPPTVEAPPAATAPPEALVEAEAAKPIAPEVPSVVEASQFPDAGPPPPPVEEIAEGIQNLSLDANGTDAKPAPPPALATPEVVPSRAAEEQISEADESGVKEDGEIDDKSATASVAGDESVQESSEELVRKMEEHLARFHDNPEVQAEFDANVYSRDFLYVLRNIVRELKLEKPAMPHSLEEVGLDRRGMPAVQQPMMGKHPRYENRGGDKFTPSWQPRAQDNMRNMLHPRAPYAGRHSDNRQRQKKGPVGRPSMDRPPRQDLLKRSENAWKPTRKISKMDSVAADPEEQRIQKRQKEIRGLLNKITPSTFADLWLEFRDQKVHEDEKLLPIVIDLIFDKAVEEPKFCGLYSDLCKNQVDHEAQLQVAEKPFRHCIIKKAQATFEGANQVKETMKELEQELEAETDEEKKQEKAISLEALRTKEKRRLQGTIRFIAELYRHFLITDTIIQWCSIHLIKTYEETKDDVYIEYAAHMIERVGPAFESRKTQRSQAPNTTGVNLIEQVMAHFMQIKDTLSNRVRFMILNLDELRQAGWKSQRFAREQGPKTIEEVHQEAKQEEIQNRLERDAYERNKHEQQRGGGGGGGYGQRNKQGYGGRPSNDYRQQQPRAPDDRRSQAAAAAISSGSGLRKDMSLKQADNQPEKLGVKSGWAKGAGGGGQSSFFSKQPQKKPDASRPAPTRSSQEAPNRDGSQPGSREQSESRGGPKSTDRKASLASKGGSEDRSSTPDQSTTGGADGARGSPAPVQSPPPPSVDEKKVAGAVRATIDEYSMDVVTIDEAFEAVNELCQRTSVQVVFKKFFAYGGEQVKPSDDNRRRYVGQIICKCLQSEPLKEDAIKGFAQYCAEAVEQELSYDCPGLWKNIARIIGWSMFCHPENVDGGRPPMDIFTPVFKAANEQSPKEFSVLVQVLQMMVEEIGNHEGMSEDDVVSSFEMTFEEVVKADPAFYDSDDFKEALKKAECQLATHPNLYSLLKPS